MRDEIALGGNLQDAVRIGDTVHRTAGPWTRAVHALLRYLERVGYPAPRVIGMDPQGREVLGFVHGEAHNGTHERLPVKLYDDSHVVAAAKLLRSYHDAIAGFRPPPEAQWRIVAPTRYEVICHNDWTPWNAVLQGGEVAVMLDWDLAGPGTRLWDVVNGMYFWAPPHIGPSVRDIARRMRLFVDSYGLEDRSEVLLTLRTRLAFVGDWVMRGAAAGDLGMRRVAAIPAPRRVFEGDIDWLEENWQALERAL